MILWMILGVLLFGYGGALLIGLGVVVWQKDSKEVADLDMTIPMFIFCLVVAALCVYGGYSLFSSNLLAASSALQ